MKICFIILSLLFIYSIICKNDNSIHIDLDFGGDVAQTIISIEKNITYYAKIKGVDDNKYVEIELTMDYTKNSPFTKFIFHQYNEFIDGDIHSSYNISLSENKKENKLVLNGEHKITSVFGNHYNLIEFVSSCDIPNLQIKVEITTRKESKESPLTIFIIIIIIIIIILFVVGVAICTAIFFGFCHCLGCFKSNQQNNPVYAPIQSP